MALDTFNPYLFVSAGEQSNKFLTPTYSGGIAKFQAQRAQQLTKLLVQIDPVQEGTGDPSPDNIRPISGRTGMTVTRAGKNRLDSSFCTNRTQNGITTVVNADGSITFSGTATSSTRFWNSNDTLGLTLPPGTYTLSPSTLTLTGDHSRSGTFTLSEETTFKNVSIRVTNGTTYDNVTIYPQLEAGASSTAYEKYTKTTYPVSWQTEAGTIYGGTLDVISGVLTVDWDYIASYNGETLPGEWISDRDVYAEGTTPTTGAEVAYKIAEPVTYQLDPEDVMTLAGFNQIYSDAGPVIDIQF